MNTLRQLRASSQFNEAIDRLLQICGDRKVDDAQKIATLREFLCSERCLVLEWACHEVANQRRHLCGDRLKKLRNIVQPLMGDPSGLFAARLALIQAVLLDGSDEVAEPRLTLKTAIRMVIEAVDYDWKYNRHQAVKLVESVDLPSNPKEPLDGPSFLQHLSSDSVRVMFHDLAGLHGWMHPGLLLAGETIAALEGHNQRADHDTTSWIMFAAKAYGKSLGLLAQLTVERIPAEQCRGGALVPDPFGCGCLQMDESFSTGLQHAWLAYRMENKAPCNYDLRWKIHIEEATCETPFASMIAIPIEGRSAEGTLTCAMLAVAAGDELDRNTCMSACLELDAARQLQSTLKLAPVGGLDVKTLANRLRDKKIRHIIVSADQTAIDLDTGSEEKFLETADIPTALDHFCIWPRMTRAVRAQIHAEATAERAALCGPLIPPERQAADGKDFVQPPIGIRNLDREAGASSLRAEPMPLSDDELEEFVRGRWRPKNVPDSSPIRLQLFADSGMGKTVQLVICEQAISGDDTLRIPIRLGKRASVNRIGKEIRPERSLTSIEWKGLLEENLKQLAELLQPYIPKEHKSRTYDWVKRLAQLGQFVFLLDALDQQRSELTHLATFLSKDEIADCPAIVAGRPESLTTHAEVFRPLHRAHQWHRLELLKFQIFHQREYLGTTLAQLLIPEQSFLYPQNSKEELRRHQWKDLLQTPLLLSLTKQLATPDPDGKTQLGNIRNRFHLYRQASVRLFQKGEKSLEPEQQSSVDEIVADVEELLKDIAGYMVKRHNFDVLEGTDFDAWKRSTGLDDQKLSRIVQIDVVKEYAFLDRMELNDLNDADHTIRRGIEWRHRSFLEYYAALSLAEEWQTNPESVKNTLRDVHESLDDNGFYRTWHFTDPVTGKRTNAFRNLPADWQWTLRFLLVASDEPARSQIALELIQSGNPWIVACSLQNDHVVLADKDVEVFCWWLVRRSKIQKLDLANLFNNNFEAEIEFVVPLVAELKEANAAYQRLANRSPELISRLLDRKSRDAAYLVNLRDLRPWGQVAKNWIQKTARIAMRRVLVRIPKCRKQRNQVEGPKLTDFLVKERWITVPGFEPQQLSDFPVTNLVFESFCASHRRLRDSYSFSDDQPALYVNWYMAVEFCEWLTDVANTGHRYYLPHENVWHAACQWGRPQEWPYWWEGEMDDDLCRHGASSKRWPSVSCSTRSRDETIAAFEHADQQHPSWNSPEHPGLLDMLGNVREWCSNPYDADADPNDPGSSRVLRGGSWGDDAGVCRSAYRSYDTPDSRTDCIGFRVCRG